MCNLCNKSPTCSSTSTHSHTFSRKILVHVPVCVHEVKDILDKEIVLEYPWTFFMTKILSFTPPWYFQKGTFFVLLLLKSFWRNFMARQTCALNFMWMLQNRVENAWLSKFNFGNVWLLRRVAGIIKNMSHLGILLALAVKTISVQWARSL